MLLSYLARCGLAPDGGRVKEETMSTTTDEFVEPDEPTELPDETEEDEPENEENILVIRVQERHLMWGAIGILALFVLIEGIGLLSLRSSAGRGGQGFGNDFVPGAEPVHAQDGIPSTGQVAPQDPYGQSGGAGMQTGAGFSPDRADRDAGASAGNEYLSLVSGEEAVTRVEAFIEDYDIAEEDAKALLAVVKETNVAIAALDARKESGELDGALYDSELEKEQENQRLKILQIIGWQNAANLYERLRTNPGGKGAGVKPPPPGKK